MPVFIWPANELTDRLDIFAPLSGGGFSSTAFVSQWPCKVTETSAEDVLDIQQAEQMKAVFIIWGNGGLPGVTTDMQGVWTDTGGIRHVFGFNGIVRVGGDATRINAVERE